MNWGTQKESRTIGTIGALSAGNCYLRGFSNYRYWPAVGEILKNKKKHFIFFPHPHKTASESMKI